MSHAISVYVGNTNVIEIDALTDLITGLAIETATVNVTIKDASGNNLAGETWPVAMSHVSAGKYRGVLSSTIAMTAETTYYAHVDAVAGANVGHWEYAFTARTRRGE